MPISATPSGPASRTRPSDAEGLVVLRDLVALRIVRVEVVLAVEDSVLGDLAAEREAESDRPLDRLPVRHGQRPRMREANRAGARVGGVERPDRATAEHLRPRLQLDVDLEADDGFPTHLRPLRDEVEGERLLRARGRRGRARSRRTAARSAASPTGRPSERPQGIDSPGRPAMFDGIVSTSERYMASGFCGPLAETEGDRRRGRRDEQVEALEQRRRARCLISVRTFWAWP